MEYDSIILKELEKKNEYYEKLYEWSGYKKMELIYRATRDGMTSKCFHDKCDNKGPTITLYKIDKNVFGGFSSISWSIDGNYHSSPDCFIFTLINEKKQEPTKFPLKENNKYAVYHNANYGPTFGEGHDIGVDKSEFLNNNSFSNFPSSYKDTIGKKKSIFTGNNEKKNFKLREIEVFQLYK